jgi:hypothetical protein
MLLVVGVSQFPLTCDLVLGTVTRSWAVVCMLLVVGVSQFPLTCDLVHGTVTHSWAGVRIVSLGVSTLLAAALLKLTLT